MPDSGKVALPFIDPALYRPAEWLVLFHPRSRHRWVERLLPGRFKHVSALGYVAAPVRCWVWCDADLWASRVMLCGADDDRAWLGSIIGDNVAIRFAACEPPVGGYASRLRSPLQLRTCVSAVKHLIGLRSGALRPDALWRDCLAHGGKVVN